MRLIVSFLSFVGVVVVLAEAFQLHPHDDSNNLKPFKLSSELLKPKTASKTDPIPIMDLINNDETKPTATPTTTNMMMSQDRRASARKKWGVDKDHPNEYWLDKRIHTLGNVGFGGAFHAALAPLSTKLIDLAAYDGINIRAEVSKEWQIEVLV
jgi:hypothetical protein